MQQARLLPVTAVVVLCQLGTLTACSSGGSDEGGFTEPLGCGDIAYATVTIYLDNVGDGPLDCTELELVQAADDPYPSDCFESSGQCTCPEWNPISAETEFLVKQAGETIGSYAGPYVPVTDGDPCGGAQFESITIEVEPLEGSGGAGGAGGAAGR